MICGHAINHPLRQPLEQPLPVLLLAQRRRALEPAAPQEASRAVSSLFRRLPTGSAQCKVCRETSARQVASWPAGGRSSPCVPCLDPLAGKVQVVGAGLNRQRQALGLGSSQLRQQVGICIPQRIGQVRATSLSDGSSSMPGATCQRTGWSRTGQEAVAPMRARPVPAKCLRRTCQVHYVQAEAWLGGIAAGCPQRCNKRTHGILFEAAGPRGQPGGVLARIALQAQRQRAGVPYSWSEASACVCACCLLPGCHSPSTHIVHSLLALLPAVHMGRQPGSQPASPAWAGLHPPALRAPAGAPPGLGWWAARRPPPLETHLESHLCLRVT